MRSVRRVISLLLYIPAGLFLMAWGVMAFADDDSETSTALLFAAMAPFALVPLALGALVSPGSRLGEVGIVLIIAAGWLGFTVATLAYLFAMPDTRVLFPPETRATVQMFDSFMIGVGFLLLMATAGLLLLRHGRRPMPD